MGCVCATGEMYPWKVGAHYLAQSGGAFFFAQALNNSKFRAKTLDDADAVFVYDYCYMIWCATQSLLQWSLLESSYYPSRFSLSWMGPLTDCALGCLYGVDISLVSMCSDGPRVSVQNSVDTYP
jgi:hypothetical protein